MIQQTIAASGGAIWQAPKTLQLSGQAIFTPYGKKEDVLVLDTYNMYRVFPSENDAARTANGKVRFDAFFGKELFFQLKFDGKNSVMDLGEMAKLYAVHFKWSNNFGFGIFRFAERPGFQVEELIEDQIEGHDCHFIKITDPKSHETFFATDKITKYIRMVGFSTEVGYHHRVYSDFQKASNGFVQPTRIRIYFDGIKWMDVRWKNFKVNEPIEASIFE